MTGVSSGLFAPVEYLPPTLDTVVKARAGDSPRTIPYSRAPQLANQMAATTGSSKSEKGAFTSHVDFFVCRSAAARTWSN